MRKLSFKNLIIFNVIILNIIFSYFIYNMFSSNIFKTIKENFIKEVKYSAVVARDQFNEEKEKQGKLAKICANDEIIFEAFVNKHYIYGLKRIRSKGTKLKFKKLTKIRYLILARNAFQKIIGSSSHFMDFMEFFDKNIKMVAQVGNSNKKYHDSKEDRYVNILYDKKMINTKVGVTTFSKKKDIYYAKGIEAIWQNGIHGAVVINKPLDSIYLREVKKIVGKEILIIEGHNVFLSTIYNNGKMIKDISINFKDEKFNEEGIIYIEKEINNKKYGLSIFELKTFENKMIAYIGIAADLDDFYHLVNKNRKRFIKYVAMFTVSILFIIFIVLSIIFKPLKRILAGIKKISEGDYLYKIKLPKTKELNILTGSLNNLSEMVYNREQEIKEKNKKLLGLEKEKQQRILADKMASLNKELSTTLILKDVLARFFNKLNTFIAYKNVYTVLKDGKTYKLWESENPYLKEFDIEKFILNNFDLYQELTREKSNKSLENFYFIDKKIKNILIFPILLRNKLIGAILFDLEEKFSSNELSLLSSLCSQLAFALENARLFEKNQKKTKELLRSNNSVKNLLNNSAQGFLHFGKTLKVEEEYSSECINIFEKEIINQNILDLLCIKEDDKQFLKELFNDIFTENKIRKIKSFFKLLPREFLIQAKNIKIDYKLIENIHNEKEIMFILSDITDKRKLELQIEREKSIIKMLVKVTVNYECFVDFVKEFKRFFNEVLDKLFLSEMENEEIIAIFFRHIHTFKGNFSQLAMVDVVELLHGFEDLIYNNKKDLEKMEREELKKFIKNLEIETAIKSDVDLLETMLGKDFFNKENIIDVDKRKLIDLERRFERFMNSSEKEKLLSNLRKLRYKSLKTMIKPYKSLSIDLAKKLNKVEINFEIKGRDVFIDPERYNEFIKSLVHVFRNIVDHGLELKEERKNLEKSEMANIICDLSLKGDYAELIISDDGRGIKLEKLKDKALENNYYSVEELENISNEDLIKLIFEDNMSTAEKLNDISGRGVGMAAVKYELEKLDGSIRVKTRENQGTKFIIKFPKLLMEV